MRYRIFGLALILSLAAALAACGGGGPEKSRSEQQSKELRERLSTTQVDR